MNQETGESTEATSPKRSETEAKSEAWISAQEAARILGISERAVQLRAQKGTLPSRRDGSRWYVRLEESAEGPKVFAEAEAKRAEVKSESSESVSPKRSEEAEADEALLMPHLLEEIAFLRSELTSQREQHAQSEAELRRLMLADKRELTELRQKVALLAAPLDVANDGKDLPDMTESKPDPTQYAQRNVTEPDQSELYLADSGREPPRRRWWEVWKRKE